MGESYSYNLNKISFVVVSLQLKVPLKLVQTSRTSHCFTDFVVNISFRFGFVVVTTTGATVFFIPEWDKMRSLLAAQICHFDFCDKKHRILTFRDKKPLLYS